MNNKDLEYIFSNIKIKKMNTYNDIPTLNTMKQYVNLTKKLGFNFDEGIGRGKQKALSLKRIDGTIVGELKDMKYPRNSFKSLELVRDKIVTENLLKRTNINTTNSKVYTEEQCDVAKQDFFKNHNAKKAVLKPTNMSQGKGVNVGVNETDFEYYWQDTVSLIKEAGRKNVKVIVQDYLEGFEARAVIIEGNLISIVARVPAYVIGNGTSTIQELVKAKNIERKKCDHLKRRPLEMDIKTEKFLKSYRLDFNTIPEKGEYILLSSLSNISHGGEMVDITNDVCDEIRNAALKTIAAIPGLYSGGVDIMMRSFDDSEPRIIEINAWPMLQSTIYPTYGRCHDPQKYFLNAFYSIDQFMNKPKQIYNIDYQDYYIRKYLEFQNLKNEISEQQILVNI